MEVGPQAEAEGSGATRARRGILACVIDPVGARGSHGTKAGMEAPKVLTCALLLAASFDIFV